MRSIFAFTAATVLALAIGACGSSKSGGLDVGVGSQAIVAPSASSSQDATPSAPANAHLYISVTEVKAHILSDAAQASSDGKGDDTSEDTSSASDAEHGSKDSQSGESSGSDTEHGGKSSHADGQHGAGDHGNGQWVTIFSGHETLDLLDPNLGEQLLGSAAVSSGYLGQIRIIIESATLQTSDKTVSLGCPSCSQSGLKLVPDAPIALPAHIVLVFEPGKSLKQNANGYWLDPVIRIAVAP